MSEVGVAQVRWRDFLDLTKPRVVSLMLLCAFVGMLLAVPGIVPLNLMFWGLLGTALVASSAAAINHVADAHIDMRMARTQNRPIATGRVHAGEGLVFAAILGITGFVILYVLVSPLTVWLNLASWVGYGFIYTFFLKRSTPHNIVIGGLFGAAPPLLGWAAITNSIEPGALILVLIIFLWTPPHFWALAIDRKDDYTEVEIPMLPVTHGIQYTKKQILLYTVLLVLSSVLPVVIGMSGLLYLVVAALLGAVFIYFAIAMLTRDDGKLPLRTFNYSIVYLILLFVGLLVDHYSSIFPLSLAL